MLLASEECMESERIKELQKPLIDALERLHRPSEVLSLIALAGEFYTAAQRTELYAHYETLVIAEAQALQAMNEASPKDSLTWEARVKMLGEQVAHKQMEPYEQARSKRVEAMRALSDFEKAHGLIVRLLEKKVSFAKRAM